MSKQQQHYSTTPSSATEGPQLWRADYELYPAFQLGRESVPLTLNYKWSAVFKEGEVTSSRQMKEAYVRLNSPLKNEFGEIRTVDFQGG